MSDAQAQPAAAQRPSISVIIPTFNRPDLLARSLAALADQSLPREDYEVVVVDDGSQSEALERVRELAHEHSAALVEGANTGLAGARNRGAERATGEILLFLDDDVVPDRDLLREHLAGHREVDGPAAIVGALPFHADVPRTTFIAYLEHCGLFEPYLVARQKFGEGRPPLPPVHGNASVAARKFRAAGGFDASFREYGSEDLELGYRLERDHGVEFRYRPSAVGNHLHTKGLAHFVRDMEKNGEALVRLYRKHPEIKEAKNIDIVEDPYRALSWKKRARKLVMDVTLGIPGGLWLVQLFLRVTSPLADRLPFLRPLLFPFFKLLGHARYAKGMKRGLQRSGRGTRSGRGPTK